jgi:hypothetical protein
MSEVPAGGPAVIRIYPDGPLLVRGPVIRLDAGASDDLRD